MNSESDRPRTSSGERGADGFRAYPRQQQARQDAEGQGVATGRRWLPGFVLGNAHSVLGSYLDHCMTTDPASKTRSLRGLDAFLGPGSGP